MVHIIRWFKKCVFLTGNTFSGRPIKALRAMFSPGVSAQYFRYYKSLIKKLVAT